MKFKIINIFIIYRVLCKMSDFHSDSESVSVIDGTGDILTFSSRLQLLGDINFPVGDINFFGN